MGSIEVRNPLLSKKLKRTETRLLIIDDNQIRFNQIRDLLTQQRTSSSSHAYSMIYKISKNSSISIGT